MKAKNPFQGIRIEFHILQSFPVTCLNRDDVDAPKTAVIGGTTRARVSSQCWKRQVRLEMRKLGITCGTRTRLIANLIKESCIKEGASEEQAVACGNKMEQIFIKTETPKKKSTKSNKEPTETKSNETLIFLSPKEVRFLAKKFKENGFIPDSVITQSDEKKQAKELAKLLGTDLTPIDAVDIGLFGRMVAKAPTMNVEAASSFSHAISTHKVRNEVEFFTALDDSLQDPGAGHLGSLEFNSATYYRYISLDLGQLWQTLRGNDLANAVNAFIKALFIAVPMARQTSQSGASFWEFAKIFVREGQRLQVPFETAVKQDGGFLQPSIDALKSYLENKKRLAGSLFKEKAEYTLGDDSDFNMDNLLEEIDIYIKGVQG